MGQKWIVFLGAVRSVYASTTAKMTAVAFNVYLSVI